MGDPGGGGFRVDDTDAQVDERYSCEKKAHERPRDVKKYRVF